jgi:hypothetical protein
VQPQLRHRDPKKGLPRPPARIDAEGNYVIGLPPKVDDKGNFVLQRPVGTPPTDAESLARDRIIDEGFDPDALIVELEKQGILGLGISAHKYDMLLQALIALGLIDALQWDGPSIEPDKNTQTRNIYEWTPEGWEPHPATGTPEALDSLQFEANRAGAAQTFDQLVAGLGQVAAARARVGAPRQVSGMRRPGGPPRFGGRGIGPGRRLPEVAGLEYAGGGRFIPGPKIDKSEPWRALQVGRLSAERSAGLRSDAVPFYQEPVGPGKAHVEGRQVGWQSPDGTRGWRLDFDPKTDKQVHINWWRTEPTGRRVGSISVASDEATYLEMLNKFEKISR